MSGVKAGEYDLNSLKKKNSNKSGSEMIWGQVSAQSPLRLITDDISAQYHM
jgi:hypothetical protein